MGEQLRVLWVEPALNIFYQRANVGASGSKIIKGETVVVSEFISGVIENHAAVQSMECFDMLPKRAD
jgi:hypothetical protein